MSSSTALSGWLRDLPIEDLLHFLASNGHTGVVELHGDVPGFIALQDGYVTLAVAEDGPSLQQVVVGSGITSVEGWHQADRATSHGVPLVDSLLRWGADAARLESVLHEQIVGALFEFVLPSDTWFTFVSGALHPIGSRFLFSTYDLVDEANRRIDAWRMIADVIPSTSMVMRLSPEAPDDIVEVSADDWRVLAQVDGYRTIAELIQSLGMSAFAVCAVLHRLVLAGIVESVGNELD